MHAKFGLIIFNHCQDIEQNEILASIKVTNSVANLRKGKLYNPNIDLINDNVHTKLGKDLSICSQDIEQKLNSDINQGL